MSTKQNPGTFDFYENALPDEPMFVLLARDPSAPDLVRQWAERRSWEIGQGERPESDRAMVKEAYDCAREMARWRIENDGKWRKPTPSGE